MACSLSPSRRRVATSARVGPFASLRLKLWRRGIQDVDYLTLAAAINPSAVARRLADAFGADCYQLTAPVFVADEATRSALWAEPALHDLVERARRVDLALLSVGDVSEDATLFREGLLPRSQLQSLIAAGAVGDVLCHFLDADGHVIDHPVSRRVIAVGLDDLRRVPKIVIAAVGRAGLATASSPSPPGGR